MSRSTIEPLISAAIAALLAGWLPGVAAAQNRDPVPAPAAGAEAEPDAKTDPETDPKADPKTGAAAGGAEAAGQGEPAGDDAAAAAAREEREREAVAVLRNEVGVAFAIAASKVRRNLIRTSTPYGFAVAGVRAGSPAAAAGLEAGVIVLMVDGTPLREVAALAAALRAAEPGTSLRLDCSRRRGRATWFDRHPWESFVVELVVPDPEAGDRGDAGGEREASAPPAAASPETGAGRRGGGPERRRRVQ